MNKTQRNWLILIAFLMVLFGGIAVVGKVAWWTVCPLFGGVAMLIGLALTEDPEEPNA